MYHYTESGLQNVWLKNGYTVHKTPYGKGMAITDVAGLHKAIGLVLARLPKLTGAQFRFLRKEMGMSQKAIATLLGTSEQNISLWERRGHIPRPSDRLVKVLYNEHVRGDNLTIKGLIERIIAQDDAPQEKLEFENDNIWKEAA